MDKNALTVALAFGMEKEARGNCHVGNRPMSNYMRSKAKKKATITKESIDAASTAEDVEVTRIDSEKAAELYDALKNLDDGQEKQAAADRLQKLKQVLVDVLGTAGVGGLGLGAVGAGAGALMPEEGEGRLSSALRHALVLGSAGTGLGAGVGLGAQFSSPKVGIPAMLGLGLGGGLGAGALAEKSVKKNPMFPKHSSAQDTKKKDEEKKPEAGTEYLDSASDEKPKKAPEKKPEKESENEVKYEKSAMDPATKEVLKAVLKRMGIGAGIGAGVGGLRGALNPGEDTPLRSAIRNALMYGGAGAGIGLGSSFKTLDPLFRDPTTSAKMSPKELLQGTGALTLYGLPLGVGAGRLIAGPAKKKEKSEDKGEEKESSFQTFIKQSLSPGVVRALKATIPGAAIGGGIGGLRGAFRGKDEGESRLGAILRDLLMGAGIGGGITGGGSAALGATGPGRQYRDLLNALVQAGRAKAQGLPGAGVTRDAISSTIDDLIARSPGKTVGLPLLGAAGGGTAAGLGLGALMPRGEKASSFRSMLKKAFGGEPATPFGNSKFGDPLRNGAKSTHRQENFDNLARWSLGK